VSNVKRPAHAPGKKEDTGKSGSFCQGFTESDCVKAKSACHWVKAANPYCARRPNSKADMNALSKFNGNKTLSNAKEVAKIVIAFSMYHADGTKMTKDEINDTIYESTSSADEFRYISESPAVNELGSLISQDLLNGYYSNPYDEDEDNYPEGEIFSDIDVSDNFFIIKVYIFSKSKALDVNDNIREIQRRINKILKTGPYELDEDIFIKSITIISQDDTTPAYFESKKKAKQGQPLYTDATHIPKWLYHKMKESQAKGEDLY
jgi:hypothetical protein